MVGGTSVDYDFKWIRPNMSLYHIDKNCPFPITLLNSGNLADDFNKYAEDFFNAAESVIHYLGEDAAENGDIAKLDLWYFAMVYLYRQSMELLLKANIFKIVTAENDRKLIIGDIRHDLKQGYDKLLELKDLEYTDNDNANWLWKYLADISRIDKESDMFRYPFGSNLNVLFDKQTHISLAATHDNMNKAFNILSELYKTGNFTEQEYEAYSPQLIIEGGHYYQQSVVGYKHAQHSFYPYYSSYEEVGNFLKEKVVNDNKKELFMPMCYMYRNAVELGLKRIIIEDSHIERTKALKILRRKKHSIRGLWNSIVDEVDKYSNAPDDDTTLNDTTQYIQAFHDFESSDLFRYPCNKNLQVYFSEEKVLDIENVASCFEELCNFLDAVDSMLSEIKDYEAEMASYYDYY